MKVWPIALAFAVLAALGLWLWSRHGLAVWVDALVAFCT
jgi:hypothetical protein